MKFLRMKLSVVFISLFFLCVYSANATDYSVTDFGAKGDGKTDATKAIQTAIDACEKNGGGRVYVPSGTYVIGPLHLKSNLVLKR